MSSQAALIQSAEKMFEQEWPRRIARTCEPTEADGCKLFHPDPSAAVTVLRQLVMLLVELHDRPVQELIPTIRLLILEHEFTDYVDDRSTNRSLQEQVDELVELFASMLEKLRQQAITRGE